LRVESSNRAAIVTIMILALTEYVSAREAGVVTRAPASWWRRSGPSTNAPITSGVVAERRARVLLDRGGPGPLPGGRRLAERGDAHVRGRCRRRETRRPVTEALLRWNAARGLFHQYPELMEAGNQRIGPVVLE
jgi:hypothetical protein